MSSKLLHSRKPNPPSISCGIETSDGDGRRMLKKGRPASTPSSSPSSLSNKLASTVLPYPLPSVYILVLAFLTAVAVVSLHISSSSSRFPVSSSSPRLCTPQDQPNPIAAVYPHNATGLLNVTLAIVPIPLTTARSIVPRKWPILEHVYTAYFASLGYAFPAGYYPLLVQAGLDHDIEVAALALSIPDFQKFGFEFPFLDRLGDNHTSFRWAPSQLITAANAVAIVGSQMYGTVVAPGTFAPPCDAYGAEPKTRKTSGSTYFRGSVGAGSTYSTDVDLRFRLLDTAPASPLPLDVLRNMTNQPSFANGTVCDQQIRLFNTSYFFGAGPRFAPRPVVGTVQTSNMAPLTGTNKWSGVHGWQVATPFIENNFLDCASLSGYDGVDLAGY